MYGKYGEDRSHFGIVERSVTAGGHVTVSKTFRAQPRNVTLFRPSRGILEKYATLASQRAGDIAAAGAEIAAIYNRNVSPDLKVTRGTYPNNLGHTDFPGCFRCHDGSHSTADGKRTIPQDCDTCHEALAVDESNPQILKTLGLAERIANLQRISAAAPEPSR